MPRRSGKSPGPLRLLRAAGEGRGAFPGQRTPGVYSHDAYLRSLQERLAALSHACDSLWAAHSDEKVAALRTLAAAPPSPLDLPGAALESSGGSDSNRTSRIAELALAREGQHLIAGLDSARAAPVMDAVLRGESPVAEMLRSHLQKGENAAADASPAPSSRTDLSDLAVEGQEMTENLRGAAADSIMDTLCRCESPVAVQLLHRLRSAHAKKHVDTDEVLARAYDAAAIDKYIDEYGTTPGSHGTRHSRTSLHAPNQARPHSSAGEYARCSPAREHFFGVAPAARRPLQGTLGAWMQRQEQRVKAVKQRALLDVSPSQSISVLLAGQAPSSVPFAWHRSQLRGKQWCGAGSPAGWQANVTLCNRTDCHSTNGGRQKRPGSAVMRATSRPTIRPDLQPQPRKLLAGGFFEVAGHSGYYTDSGLDQLETAAPPSRFERGFHGLGLRQDVARSAVRADGADDGRGLGATLAGESPAVSEMDFGARQNKVGVADPLQSRDVAMRAQGNILPSSGHVKTEEARLRSFSQAMGSENPQWTEEIGRVGRMTVGAKLVSDDAASQEEMEKRAVWDLGKPTHALAKMMRFADVLYNDLHLPTPKGCKSKDWFPLPSAMRAKETHSPLSGNNSARGAGATGGGGSAEQAANNVAPPPKYETGSWYHRNAPKDSRG